jgi:AAHS family 4-hydroxybenzoate transporter-like MFS transporter
MFCGFPLGAVVGAVGSAPLIATFGWKAVFIGGGLIPMLLLPLLIRIVPESAAWLRRRGRTNQIERILEHMGRRQDWDGDISDIAEERPSVAITAAFQQGRALGTILFACAFFVSLLGVYLLVSWVPTIAAQAGHSVKASIMAAAVLNLTGIIGSLLIARANDRLNPYLVVSGAFAFGALAILVLALTFDVGAAIFPFTIVAGLLCIGAQVSLVSLASAYYPVEVRARGLGILMAAGRVGAIAGPLVGGMFIDESHAGKVLAYVVGTAFFLAGSAVFLSRRSSPAS